MTLTDKKAIILILIFVKLRAYIIYITSKLSLQGLYILCTMWDVMYFVVHYTTYTRALWEYPTHSIDNRIFSGKRRNYSLTMNHEGQMTPVRGRGTAVDPCFTSSLQEYLIILLNRPTLEPLFIVIFQMWFRDEKYFKVYLDTLEWAWS